jgi:cytochrome P450
VGHLIERLRDPLGCYLKLALRHGPVVKVKVGGWRVYIISDPEGVKRVLADNVKNYPKGDAFARLKPIFGNGLLTSEGEFWKRQRKLAQPAFHRQNLSALFEDMRRSIQDLLQRWEEGFATTGSPFNVAAEMTRLTMSIVSRALLGLDVGSEADEVGRALPLVLAEGNRRLLSYFSLPNFIPTPAGIKSYRALKVLDGIVYRIIAKRRVDGALRVDLLSMLMSARDEETGEAMDEKQLRDEVMTIFLAGHETTANALSWTWYLLGSHPEVRRKLCEEIDGQLCSKDPVFEDVPKLRYTRQVFEEALRLYPPAWTFSRTVSEDDVICGYRISKGSLVVINPYLMHHHPAYWHDPERFDPERFAPERVESRHRYVYIPFGAGPRQCIGNQFAMTEAIFILAMVCRRYEMALEPGQTVKPEALLTLRPVPGVEVRIKKRNL